MSDEKPPDQPTTKEIPKVDPTYELLKKLDIKVDRLVLDVQVLSGNQQDLTQRATITDRRLTEFEEWRARASERAKAEETSRSKVDEEHAAQLVHLADEVKRATESQTAVLLEKMAKTPHGQRIVNGLVGLVLLVIAVISMWLSAKVGLR